MEEVGQMERRNIVGARKSTTKREGYDGGLLAGRLLGKGAWYVVSYIYIYI